MKKFKIIIEGDNEAHEFDHLAGAINAYRKALDEHDQSQITLLRVLP